MIKLTLAFIVLCSVCVNSDDSYGSSRMPDFVRIKRAKYYSSPPVRFYRRPPIPHPVKGIFSYTPPPNYMDHDEPHPGNFKPKVSKRPTNQPPSNSRPPSSSGLEDEDINNIVKHLSKQDLDKIIEFAGEKYREPQFEKYVPASNNVPIDDSRDVRVYKSTAWDSSADQMSQNGPSYKEPKSYDMEYKENSRPPTYFNAPKAIITSPDNDSFRGPLLNVYDGANDQLNFERNSPPVPNRLQDQEVPLHTEESMQQFSFVDSYIQQELSGATSQKAVTGTDSGTWNEEQLNRPIREDIDHHSAPTNNVPTVVKSSQYQVESFGDLPLMDYSSKRESVSSYHVPHYSVVSPSHHYGPSSPPHVSHSSSSQLVSSPAAAALKVPKLEPAPPASAAKEQSDAHLKATRIWTHHSAGTAYTLHNDGSLSLERPQRPKPVYGP